MNNRTWSEGNRGWWGYGIFLVVVMTPPLSLWLLSEQGSMLAAAANADGMALAPAGLAAGAFLYAARRVAPRACPAWLVAATIAMGIKAAGLAGMQLTYSGLNEEQHRWLTVLDLLFVLGVLAFALLDERPWFRASPVAWGVGYGLLLVSLRGVVVARDPWIQDGPALRLVQALVVLGLLGLVAHQVHRTTAEQPWLHHRMLLAVTMFALTRPLQTLGAGNEAVAAVALVTTVLAASAVLDGSSRTLRVALSSMSERTVGLETRLAQVEAFDREHRTQMHEIESAVVGIVRAHDLIRRADVVPADRRTRLETMIEDELGRLERLLVRGVPAFVDGSVPRERGTAFDLDATLDTLATAQEAKGSSVRWSPTGRRLSGHCDEVAEVLNILFDNAARHGGTPASVAVQESAEGVEILVSDSGPGIAPEIRDRLFEYGACGPESPGQGIGLHHASALMTRVGGYLRLGDEERDGTTFVVGVPR